MDISILKINASTWNQDAHDLYDYECQTCSKTSFRSSSSISILRSNLEISFESPESSPSSNEIAKLIKSESFKIQKSPNSDLWLVIKSLENGYDLQNNDTLKLGRLQYKALILDPSVPLDNPWTRQSSKSLSDCRICLSDENSSTNPLISPCQCSGSMQQIHFECLSKWIKLRLITKIIGEKLVRMWKNIECEICKTPFKGYKNFLDLNTHFNMKEPVLMLENFDGLKPGNKNVWAIQMGEGESIVLGRAFDCDVRISDISVSRNHAIIENCKGNFVIKEKKSKFGTLVKIDSFDIFQNVQVQAGRTLISFELGEPSSF
jgi:hypothetical protein